MALRFGTRRSETRASVVPVRVGAERMGAIRVLQPGDARARVRRGGGPGRAPRRRRARRRVQKETARVFRRARRAGGVVLRYDRKRSRPASRRGVLPQNPHSERRFSQTEPPGRRRERRRGPRGETARSPRDVRRVQRRRAGAFSANARRRRQPSVRALGKGAARATASVKQAPARRALDSVFGSGWGRALVVAASVLLGQKYGDDITREVSRCAATTRDAGRSALVAGRRFADETIGPVLDETIAPFLNRHVAARLPGDAAFREGRGGAGKGGRRRRSRSRSRSRSRRRRRRSRR